ncbi:Uma2 family endonuclease [Caldicellulosiruptor changbaiensis]|uniref:Uma2 family endonuclease n=1 Tax=Caldicellulosiruptor changbaiensis TaxID=1222016 RepID=A0A3T0D3P2_9FIRM|nr:Uma2 family endonuclease [Caldicellulosiruptor changbaiensis]AZT89679.1 Uma2 family endonuclease [Caldicellulosiruptor changbaiensis]
MEAELNKGYTYRDYVSLNDRKRYELINGELYLLASPSEIHQRVVGNLFGLLWQFFRDKPCNVYIAPFDVLFGEEEELDVKTVLQPDIFVVCDKSKLDSKRYCKGAPDFVIEVLSPSSVTADFVLKYNIYERYS